MKVVTAGQMREIEQRSVARGVSLDRLMENAGLIVANAVEALLTQTYGARVVVLVGPGNNGSDGLVVARHLAHRGSNVTAYALTRRPNLDEKRSLAEDAGVGFVSLNGVPNAAEVIASAVSTCDVLIDAVLGTGQSRDIEQPLAATLQVARNARQVVAVDVPTGMNTDTGRFDPNGLDADVTLMLGLPKLGPLVTAGDGVCGRIQVLDIGIPSGTDTDLNTQWLTGDAASALLPQRPGSANKGTFGRTLIVGGSRNYLGAPLLATGVALRSGCGLTYLATPEAVYDRIAGSAQEAIYLPMPGSDAGEFDPNEAARLVLDAAADMDSILVGPGLGQSSQAIQLVEVIVRNLSSETRVVLDADALNILSRTPGWADAMAAPRVLTPHPGEMARLLKTDVPTVQADRPAAVLEAARKFKATIVLKGAATLIATSSGAMRVSPWVNPGMAKGGTGDVLAGLLSGLLAQSPTSEFDMASLAVYVHGLAGDIAKKRNGERGMTAGDVSGSLPQAFMSLDR